jgi:opacity protein-like surface antigen
VNKVVKVQFVQIEGTYVREGFFFLWFVLRLAESLGYKLVFQIHKENHFMKKFLSLTLGLMMTASVSMAADAVATPAGTPSVSTTPVVSSTPSVVATPSATSVPKASASVVSSNGGFFIQADGGLVLPVSSQAATALSAGWDALGKVGYAFDNAWSLGIKSGYSSEPGANAYFTSAVKANFNQVPLVLEGQINLTDGPFTPFVTLGAGLVFDSISYTVSGGYASSGKSPNWTNFALDPGIGFSYAFDKSFKLFIEADYLIDFENSNQTSATSEFADNPLMLIPINVGVNILL